MARRTVGAHLSECDGCLQTYRFAPFAALRSVAVMWPRRDDLVAVR